MTAPRLHPRLGLGSFAYRYAAGVPGFMPEAPMDAAAFVRRASSLGFSYVLLCENLRYQDMPDASLKALAEVARAEGVRLDVGFRALDALERHLEIADLLGARTLRVVLGDGGPLLPACPARLKAEATQRLAEIAPALMHSGMRLGIENNFELPIDDLVSIVRGLDTPAVGLIMDTTNCLGLIEEPYGVLSRMAPYLHSVHVKDYIVRKVEAGYRVEGVSLGEGWLDVARFVRHVEALCPGVDILVEYSMRREEGATVAGAIEREERLNRENAAYLCAHFPDWISSDRL